MKILILPGDGIGPEIMAATVMALQALNDTCALKLDFEERTIGMAALEADGSTLSDELMGHIKAADGVILGPCDTYAYPPKEEGGINPSATTGDGVEGIWAVADQLTCDLVTSPRPSGRMASRCGRAKSVIT